MLFKVLKLFGLDVPAKVHEVKTSLEQRVQETLGNARDVAQGAAVVAGLGLVAAITAFMAIIVGLVALYMWVADAYGVFAGLGVVAALLILVTVILLAFAVAKSRSIGADRPEPTAAVARARIETQAAAESARRAAAPIPGGMREVLEPVSSPRIAALSAPPAPQTQASDLIEPLAYLISDITKYPSLNNPILDAVLANLKTAAESSANDAVERAANMIRYGDRTNLFLILGGAGFVGWVLARQATHSASSSRH